MNGRHGPLFVANSLALRKLLMLQPSLLLGFPRRLGWREFFFGPRIAVPEHRYVCLKARNRTERQWHLGPIARRNAAGVIARAELEWAPAARAQAEVGGVLAHELISSAALQHSVIGPKSQKLRAIACKQVNAAAVWVTRTPEFGFGVTPIHGAKIAAKIAVMTPNVPKPLPSYGCLMTLRNT